MVKSRETVKTPDDPVSPRRISIPGTLAFAAFLTAILYLAFFHLAPDSPIHSGGNPPPGLARQRLLLNNLDALMGKAAPGRNVEFHVRGSNDLWAADGKFFDTAYVSAVYSQFPARVLVGNDDTIINFARDLQHADQLPSDSWLAEHQVAAVFNLLPGDESGPQVLIHPLSR